MRRTFFSFLLFSAAWATSGCIVGPADCVDADGSCYGALFAIAMQRWPNCPGSTNLPYPLQLTGTVSVLAGSAGMIGGTDGIGAAARFNQPRGLISDCEYIYVFEQGNHTIRRINIATTEVSTLAGLAASFGAIDGPGSVARFQGPRAGAIVGPYLYVADSNNHLIRRVHRITGETVTVAGQAGVPGSQNGIGTAATFNIPSSIAWIGDSLYVAESINRTIRRIRLANYEVSLFAGQTGVAGVSDGIGTGATLPTMIGMAFDFQNLYIPDSATHNIRRIQVSTARVDTIAGQTGVNGFQDGAAASALFDSPRGGGSDGVNVYISDYTNNRLRRLNTLSGEVSTIATLPAGALEGNPAVSLNAAFIADFSASVIRRVD